MASSIHMPTPLHPIYEGGVAVLVATAQAASVSPGWRPAEWTL